MVSSSLSVLVGALFVLLASLNVVEASANYQVAAFFQSTPLTAEIAALAQSLAMFDSLGQYLLNCEVLEPGKSTAGRDRDLAVREETAAMLRGSQGGEEGRDLAASTCPSACSTSGSTKCKSLGCAFCDRCRRRRELPYSSLPSGSSGSTTNSTTGTTPANTTSGTTSTSSNATAGSNFTGTSSQALDIEKGFNDLLKPYCVSFPGCKIWTKIYRVLDNGKMYPLTG
jgi:hypothetical protein